MVISVKMGKLVDGSLSLFHQQLSPPPRGHWAPVAPGRGDVTGAAVGFSASTACTAASMVSASATVALRPARGEGRWQANNSSFETILEQNFKNKLCKG